jgi:hypothetical protein
MTKINAQLERLYTLRYSKILDSTRFIRLNASTALKVINSFDLPAAAVWNMFTHPHYFLSMEIDQTPETLYCCLGFISSVVRNSSSTPLPNSGTQILPSCSQGQLTFTSYSRNIYSHSKYIYFRV